MELVDQAKEIKRIQGIFNNKRSSQRDSFGYFIEKGREYFVNWFLTIDRKCCYCGIEEYKLKVIFESGTLSTKRNTRGKTLELERIDSKTNQYTEANCKLACYFCNNHKSDIISKEDHLKYFAPMIKNYLEDVYNRSLK